MQPYANQNGQSGIRAYKAGDDFIDVQFSNGSVYRYDYDIPGQADVEEMKRLAAKGEGLSTYISRNVRENYSARLK